MIRLNLVYWFTLLYTSSAPAKPGNRRIPPSLPIPGQDGITGFMKKPVDARFRCQAAKSRPNRFRTVIFMKIRKAPYAQI